MSTEPKASRQPSNLRVCVAQLGARRHYAVPRILHGAGLLDCLYTDSYVGNKPWLLHLLRLAAYHTGSIHAQRYLGRFSADVPNEKVVSFDLLGLRYTAGLRLRRPIVATSDLYSAFAAQFGRSVVARGFGFANAVYGFNGASVEVFEAAKQRGIRCILDQTIVPISVQRSILKEEFTKWPSWQIDQPRMETADPLEGRDAHEWKLADLILCGSQFVAERMSSVGCETEKCKVVPYGYDVTDIKKCFPRKRPRIERENIRLLFVGEVGLRKGVPYLLEALRGFRSGEVKVKFAGSVRLNPNKLNSYKPWADFLGRVPRSEMGKLYQWADALVLPSLCEGSAMATYEAQAFGLPVICTPNTGSTIASGINGIIVHPGNIDDLKEAIKSIPELSDRMALRCRDAPKLYSPFRTYSENLLEAIGAL